MLSNLVCPDCRCSLIENMEELECPSCYRHYPITGGIPDFRHKDYYWCNVSREKMQKLNRMADETGDWLGSAKKIVPEYGEHFIPFNRADAQFLWPTTQNSRILDAGCMWGGITIPVAQFHREVYAVDKTIETLAFLKIRAKQMGFKNIYAVASTLQRLPFPDSFFDLVVLNGVLEWTGLEQDVVLEKHWNGRWENLISSDKSPTKLQLECLKELLRVLKPGAAVYVAIENRIGIQYLLGYPDDHVNIRFVTFLPRFLANYITKKKRNIEYRTHIHSPSKLKDLISKAGFRNIEIYSIFPHYGQIERLVSFSLLPLLRSVILNGPFIGPVKSAWKYIPHNLASYFSPSVAVIANKASRAHGERPKSRLISILEKWRLLEPDSNYDRYKAMIVNSRFQDFNPCCYAIFDNDHGRITYFCKIGRRKEAWELLKHEAEQIDSARQIFENSPVLKHLPDIVQFCEIDNIPLLVTRFISGKPVMNGLMGSLKILPPERFGKSPFIKKLTLQLNRYASKRWLKEINPTMIKALDLLFALQKESTVRKVSGVEYLTANIESQQTEIIKKGFMTEKILDCVERVKKEISSMDDFDLPLCFQHGDFDLCNFLECERELFLVDFEHSETCMLPFFDLGNILFSTLLSDWKQTGKKFIFQDYLNFYGWTQYIQKWVKYYNKISGLPIDILKFLPSLAALEQNSKKYPPYRDPYTYPMYGITSLETLCQWKILA